MSVLGCCFFTEVVIKIYHKSVSWGLWWDVREWETRRATTLLFVLLIDFHRQFSSSQLPWYFVMSSKVILSAQWNVVEKMTELLWKSGNIWPNNKFMRIWIDQTFDLLFFQNLIVSDMIEDSPLIQIYWGSILSPKQPNVSISKYGFRGLKH